MSLKLSFFFFKGKISPNNPTTHHSQLNEEYIFFKKSTNDRINKVHDV